MTSPKTAVLNPLRLNFVAWSWIWWSWDGAYYGTCSWTITRKAADHWWSAVHRLRTAVLKQTN